LALLLVEQWREGEGHRIDDRSQLLPRRRDDALVLLGGRLKHGAYRCLLIGAQLQCVLHACDEARRATGGTESRPLQCALTNQAEGKAEGERREQNDGRFDFEFHR
jgi:hypothetical protein